MPTNVTPIRFRYASEPLISAWSLACDDAVRPYRGSIVSQVLPVSTSSHQWALFAVADGDVEPFAVSALTALANETRAAFHPKSYEHPVELSPRQTRGFCWLFGQLEEYAGPGLPVFR